MAIKDPKTSIFDMKQDSERVAKEVRQKVAGYLAGGLGLVAGLAWNDAVISLINYLFPIEKNTLLAKFIYAIGITIVVVVVTIYIMRLLQKSDAASN